MNDTFEDRVKDIAAGYPDALARKRVGDEVLGSRCFPRDRITEEEWRGMEALQRRSDAITEECARMVRELDQKLTDDYYYYLKHDLPRREYWGC